MDKTRESVVAVFKKATQNNLVPVTVARADLALVVGADKVESMNVDPDETSGSMILVSGAELWNACGGTPQRESPPAEFDDEDELDDEEATEEDDT